MGIVLVGGTMMGFANKRPIQTPSDKLRGSISLIWTLSFWVVNDWKSSNEHLKDHCYTETRISFCSVVWVGDVWLKRNSWGVFFDFFWFSRHGSLLVTTDEEHPNISLLWFSGEYVCIKLCYVQRWPRWRVSFFWSRCFSQTMPT